MPRPLLLSAGLLGVVAGLRSALPNAAVARRGLEPSAGPLRLLGSSGGRRGAYLAAAGEIVADKLPSTPSRLGRGPLAGRLVAGALAGATLASARGSGGARLAVPAVVAAAGAGLGAWGGHGARSSLVRATGLPDPVVAVAEDLLAVGLAALALGEGPR